MSWESRYVSPDPRIWQGRADIPSDSCFYQHIRLLNLLSQEPEKTAEIAFAIAFLAALQTTYATIMSAEDFLQKAAAQTRTEEAMA